MNQELVEVVPGVHSTSRAVMQAEVVDAVVFDVDGVLIDVHHSYPLVICLATEAYLKEVGFTGTKPPVTPEETTFFKAAGGFNSDWNLTQGIVLSYLVKSAARGSRDLDALVGAEPNLETIARASAEFGGGLAGLTQGLKNLVELKDWQGIQDLWDGERITRLCQEFYAGEEADIVFGLADPQVTGPGMMKREKPLVSREALERAGLQYGVYTGRNYGETLKALDLAGLHGVFRREAMITESEGLKKPNPEGLFRIAKVLRPRLMIFAGDNLDDWQTASRYEAERSLEDPPCLFCGVLGGSPGPLSYGLFRERGATLLTQSAEALIAWVAERRRAPG